MAWDMKAADIRRNLEDAGCSEELIGRFIQAFEAGAAHECARILEGYRRTLLEDIHTGEEKLDCLDYLRYQMKRA